MRHVSSDQLFTTSVAAEEVLKGRLAYPHRNHNSPKSIVGHADLVATLAYLHEWKILLYDDGAHLLLATLKKKRIRIGSQDLRIAAITLYHGFTLITCNRGDFMHVPNLKIEDWTISPRP